MKCKQCGTEFEGKFCPNCGVQVQWASMTERQPVEQQPIMQQSATPKKPIYKKWWFWVIIVIVVIGIGSNLGDNKDKSIANNTDSDTSSISTTTTESENTHSESSSVSKSTTTTAPTIPSKTETPSKATPPSDSTPTISKYEQIYNEYSKKIKEAAPNVGITELAEISNEGVSKMADYMLSAKGKDGQYATYEEWAGKLMDVYMNEAR